MSAASSAVVGWSWNLPADVRTMWSFPFMVNAFRAGTIVAITAGVTGWFMVLRRQTFAGHTLAVAAFPGAAAATLLGVSAVAGYFTFCVAAAIVIAFASGSARMNGFSEESAAVGTVQAFVLACGFLFSYLYNGNLSGVNTLLFGDFLGIGSSQVVVLAVVGIATLAVLGGAGRPLLFASVDADVAAARGVRVRALGVGFLVLLGVGAAEASQITGALLVFALLVMPAATAQRLTSRPGPSIVLTVVLALVETWAGLTMAFFTPYAIGFCLTTIAFGIYVVVRLVTASDALVVGGAHGRGVRGRDLASSGALP